MIQPELLPYTTVLFHALTNYFVPLKLSLLLMADFLGWEVSLRTGPDLPIRIGALLCLLEGIIMNDTFKSLSDNVAKDTRQVWNARPTPQAHYQAIAQVQVPFAIDDIVAAVTISLPLLHLLLT
jgi:hypothetical protein